MKSAENNKELSSLSQRRSNINYPDWLNQAIFYQIYPQSFYDSNGDGIGEISGIIQKLDCLQWLGINAIWINPCFVSPFQDAGYDVADYYRIAPRYGTNRDLYKLCSETHRRGIRVCLDLVAGHTSVEHPWFKASSRRKGKKYTDRYVWVPPEENYNNTGLSLIPGFADNGDSYIANCFDFQPALNYGFAVPDQPWQQPVDASGPRETRKDLIKIMDYWLGHGVDGFRVDMAFSLVKNDPGHNETIKLWQEINQEIRTKYPDLVLISEWGNPEESIAAGFDIDFMLHFGVSGYPDLLLNENSFFRRKNGVNIRAFLKPYLDMVEETEGKGLISIPSANHDIKRPSADGRTFADLKVIFTFLLTWPGVPFIYYGDEIGMRYLPGLPSKEGGFGRTGSRTPMQWNDGLNAGFSLAETEKLYLPIDPRKKRPYVESQSRDSSSLLNHVRKLIDLRRQHPALQTEGALTLLQVENDHRYFAYLRQAHDKRFLIVINPSAESSRVRLYNIQPENITPQICHGMEVYVEQDDLEVQMTGVSYGVFRL
ncbi:MAG: alpha-glucosidase C-terminal domain-containing protein [Dehalococcoidales bacterium]|nr:MAG: alpha-glucosidase C-terminal domain-containing protein [Dehalococcoidales bacterium]